MYTFPRRIVLLLILFIVPTSIFAQDVNSLKSDFNVASTKRQKALLALGICKSYDADNPDSCLFYSGIALNLAKDIKDDSVVMESYARIGFAYQDKNLLDKSKEYLDKAVALARSMHNDMRLMRFLISESYGLRDQRNNEAGIEACEAALPLAISLKLKDREAEIYTLQGALYTQEDNYGLALNMLDHSMKIYDSLKLTKELAGNYERVAILYAKQKKYKESLQYSMLEDSLYTRLHDETDRAVGRLNMAITYKNMGNYDKAISLYEQALKSFGSNGYYQMYGYVNLGIAFSAKGEYNTARTYFTRVNNLNSTTYHDKNVDFSFHKEMAVTYLKQGMLDSALFHALLCEQDDSGKSPHMEEYSDCLKLLAKIYTARGDLKNASTYYNRYENMQDTAIAALLQGKEAEAGARFKLGEKNRQLSLLVNENEVARLKVRAQRIASIILITSLLLGIIIIFAVIAAYKRAVQKTLVLSEQKKIIDAQMVQLATAANVKSIFLANISHELRTPVTLLTGMLEMVQNKSSLQSENEKLRIAYNNSRKLQSIVEEILDLSRVESKEVTVNCKVLPVTPLLKRTVYAFETLIQKKRLFLDYNDQAYSICVSTDEDKFEKIINNLVYNAIKFNKEGGSIKVRSYIATDKKNWVIEISDTGVGIPATDLPHIFERFYQVATAGKVKAEGVGIGLSLVKEFTLLLGGTVTVASTEGYGTIFTLQFPVAEQNAIPVTSEADELPMPVIDWKATGKKTILIAEDNDEMRYYIKEMLGDTLHVVETTNGKEALSWMKNYTPDLIISDMMMPEMDGKEFITQVKSISVYSGIPVITLTALADTESQMSMLRIGVDDYIVKPFNADELRIRVHNLLHNSMVRQQFMEEPLEPDDIAVEDNKEAELLRERVKAYVLMNIKREDISVDDIAAELGVSKRQLYRVTQSLTGFTPAQMIKEIRLQKAYELLQNGDIQKIENVARAVGFATTNYFSRQFLDRFGKRATDFL